MDPGLYSGAGQNLQKNQSPDLGTFAIFLVICLALAFEGAQYYDSEIWVPCWNLSLIN